MRALARKFARRWLSSDVARANAAQASIRLSTMRREREAVDAYVRQEPSPRLYQAARGGPSMTAALRGDVSH